MSFYTLQAIKRDRYGPCSIHANSKPKGVEQFNVIVCHLQTRVHQTMKHLTENCLVSFFTDRVAIISITRRSILNYNRLSYNKYFRIFYNKRLRTVKLCYPLKAFAKNTLKWRILPREVSKKLTLKLLHFQHLEIYSLKWLFFLSRESFTAKFIPSNLFTETRRSFIANKQLKWILFFFLNGV